MTECSIMQKLQDILTIVGREMVNKSFKLSKVSGRVRPPPLLDILEVLASSLQYDITESDIFQWFLLRDYALGFKEKEKWSRNDKF